MAKWSLSVMVSALSMGAFALGWGAVAAAAAVTHMDGQADGGGDHSKHLSCRGGAQEAMPIALAVDMLRSEGKLLDLGAHVETEEPLDHAVLALDGWELADDRGTTLAQGGSDQLLDVKSGEILSGSSIDLRALSEGYYRLTSRVVAYKVGAESQLDAADDELSSVKDTYFRVDDGELVEMTVSEWFEQSQAGLALQLGDQK